MIVLLKGGCRAAAISLLSVAVVWSTYGATLDRDYRFGEDPGEGGSAGGAVGVNIGGTDFTFDSYGSLGVGDLQDLTVVGNPTYANVSDRTGFSGGVGIAFDGNGDYLRGANLNLPETSQAAFGNDDDSGDQQTPGPNNYTNIVDRMLQFWVKPDAGGQNSTQSVVMDSNQHGVRIVAGKWSMRYNGTDFDSDMPVSFGDWNHVMLARPFRAAEGSQMYVNGVAVAAAPGGYDGSAHEELVIGSTTSRDSNRNFTGGTGEYFRGVMDNLTMSIIGDNTTDGGEDFGGFDLASDNEFLSLTLGSLLPGDINEDGSVSGDGTGPAASDDVTAFVDGWLSRNLVNDVQLGDLGSRRQGDLNLDGVTNLADWAILNSASPAVGAAVAASIPEPSTAVLLSLAFLALVGPRRRVK